MVETERGCGWRQVGGVYLVGSGLSRTCDALPFEVKECGECGFALKMSRSIQGVHAGYLAALLKDHVCGEAWPCPLCYFAGVYPTLKATLSQKEMALRGVPSKVFFMFVSKKEYSPASFIEEARTQGISKRISPNGLPNDFRLGDDWVYLVHNHVGFKKAFKGEGGSLEAETVYKRAVFYAFRPERIEVVLWADTDPRTVQEYQEAGYTPVLIERTPENQERHGAREKDLPDIVQDYDALARRRKLKKVSFPKKGAFKDTRAALPPGGE